LFSSNSFLIKPLPLHCGTPPVKEHPATVIHEHNKPRKKRRKNNRLFMLTVHLHEKSNHSMEINPFTKPEIVEVENAAGHNEG
jgi:hypothetical protein